MRFHVRLLTSLLAVWALAAPAAAQIDQGRLTGTVTDAQGGVLPGVTVTAKSPALIGARYGRHRGRRQVLDRRRSRRASTS